MHIDDRKTVTVDGAAIHQLVLKMNANVERAMWRISANAPQLRMEGQGPRDQYATDIHLAKALGWRMAKTLNVNNTSPVRYIESRDTATFYCSDNPWSVSVTPVSLLGEVE